jgi:hypothetical protein
LYYAIEANRWAAATTTMITCDKDLNKDGEKDCLLMNQHFFLIVDLNSGYLPFLAVKGRDNQFFQVSGSSSQLMFGLSPSQEWDLTQKVFSDPSVLPGIRIHPSTKMRVLSIAANQKQLLIALQDDSDTLRITLNEENLKLEYNLSAEPTTLQLPFICPNPQQPQSYAITAEPAHSLNLISACEDNQFAFRISGQIRTIQNASGVDIHSLIQTPENPDFEYPKAHYLPIGLSLSEITFDSHLTLSLSVPN